MSKLNKSFIGVSLSHATMRPEDLIPAFHNFLNENGYKGTRYSGLLVNLAGRGVRFNSEKLADMATFELEELFDKLNEIAPEGTYFGASEGDGSDFGFWEVEAEL